MTLKQRLDQKQVHKLILAPALQQAIKLLTMTNLELLDIIYQEVSQNPMLELEDESRERREPNEELRQEKGETGEDPDVEKYFQEYFDNEFRYFSFEKKEPLSLENVASRGLSLWDHLNWQASLTFFDEKEREIALYIIGNINEEGYLVVPVKEIAEEMKVSEREVEKIREKIKRFDPVSVGSLDLKEILLTQMDYYHVDDEISRKIIEDHLPLLEKSDYPQLAKELEIPMEEIKPHIEVIRSLNPRPGRKYSSERTSYVVPDIIVKKEDGQYNIILNNEGLPSLRINTFYKRLLNQNKKDSESLDFLKDKMKKAFWFLKSLEQRNQTVAKVAHYIVDKQKDFIEKGIDYIKPMTLVELAREIGVHESTVGRVVSNKYMMTPRGIFPLKYFFHKSLFTDVGEGVSSLRVKDRIKKLVENEDKNNPLSDSEIGEVLAKEDFKIARRTVAKYRKQLKIAPSHIRKRINMMEDS